MQPELGEITLSKPYPSMDVSPVIRTFGSFQPNQASQNVISRHANNFRIHTGSIEVTSLYF